jgi:hypothetical protein
MIKDTVFRQWMQPDDRATTPARVDDVKPMNPCFLLHLKNGGCKGATPMSTAIQAINLFKPNIPAIRVAKYTDQWQPIAAVSPSIARTQYQGQQG